MPSVLSNYYFVPMPLKWQRCITFHPLSYAPQWIYFLHFIYFAVLFQSEVHSISFLTCYTWTSNQTAVATMNKLCQRYIFLKDIWTRQVLAPNRKEYSRTTDDVRQMIGAAHMNLQLRWPKNTVLQLQNTCTDPWL